MPPAVAALPWVLLCSWEDQQPPITQQSVTSSPSVAQGWELSLQAMAVQTPPLPLVDWGLHGTQPCVAFALSPTFPQLF